MGSTAEEWSEIENYVLMRIPELEDIDYYWARSYRRKHVFKLLLMNKRLPKNSIRNAMPQKRDAKNFVYDMVEVAQIAKDNHSEVWLSIDYIIGSGLFKRKKVK